MGTSRVEPVDLVQVDVVRPEPPEALIDLVQDGDPGQPGAVRTRPHPAVHLRGDHDILPVSQLTEHLSQDLLARTVGIHVRGVEGGHAQLQRPGDDGPARLQRKRPRMGAARRVPEAHASDDDGRDLQAAVANPRVFHPSTLQLLRAQYSGRMKWWRGDDRGGAPAAGSLAGLRRRGAGDRAAGPRRRYRTVPGRSRRRHHRARANAGETPYAPPTADDPSWIVEFEEPFTGLDGSGPHASAKVPERLLELAPTSP